MSIEEQLSLSKNGGVYYDGIRMDPSDDAFLFVGMGGTGADALLRIKNEIKNRMRLKHTDKDGKVTMLDIPANMALLAFDTDDRTLTEKSYGIASFDSLGREYVDLNVNEKAKVYSDITRNHIQSPRWSWLDKRLKVDTIQHGAGGIRQAGRMMLIQNYKTVKERVNEELARLHQTEPKHTNIILVSGIAGGTGSGTFLDMAFLLRYFAEQVGLPNTQVLGYIVLPDLNAKKGGAEASLYSNGFAALKELEYWMSMSDHGESFVQQYDETFKLTANLAPFDFCHLISAQDLEDHPVSYEEALEALAENVFGYCVEDKSVDAEGNTAMVSMYSNINTYISAIAKPYPANHRYLSIGASKLEIPYTEITTLIAARIFEKLSPVFSYAPTKDTFSNEFKRMGFTDDSLRSFVQQGVAQSPLKTRKFKYKDVWNKGGNNKVHALHESYHANTQIKLRTNSSNLPKDCEGRGRTEFKSMMASNSRGPCYVAKLIKSNTTFSIINTLEGYRIQYSDLEIQEGQNSERYKREAEEAFIAGMNTKLQKGKVLGEYLSAMNRYDDSLYLWYMYGDLKTAVEELIKRLNKYYNKIFKPLDDILQLLPGIFNKNIEYIKTSAAKSKWLISPIQFEKENSAVVKKAVDDAASVFFREMTDKLPLWIGCELDDVNSDITGMKKADIPGFISEFIQNNFKLALQISIEDLIKKNIKTGDTFKNYASSLFLGLNNDAVPMYRPSPAQRNANTSKFAFISIPDVCTEEFFGAAKSVPFPGMAQRNVTIKKSGERSKISLVTVISGMTLYSFKIMEDMEAAYENAYMHSDAFLGIHLKDSWREEMASPIPEGTWSDGYVCDNTKIRNRKNRMCFDKCVGSEIVKYADGDSAAKLFLTNESDIKNIDLDIESPFYERKAIIERERGKLWKDKFIELQPCGTYLIDTEGKLANIRENTLRFYSICKLIEEQHKLLDLFSLQVKRLDDTELYAYALMLKMIQNSGGRRIFRKSPEDIHPRVLLEMSALEENRQYYAEFIKFSEGLTENEIENIKKRKEDARKKMVKDTATRNSVSDYITQISVKTEEYANAVDDLMERKGAEELPAYKEEKCFYQDISKIANSYVKGIKSMDVDEKEGDFNF